MRRRRASALLAAVLGTVIGMVAACFVSGCATDPPPGAAAPAAYEAELLKCVTDAKSRAEADACRARVDAAYGQRKDGGS